MSNQQVLDKIAGIDSNNEFLKYIVPRIKCPNYRGIHISQHNRYDLEKLQKMLEVINQVVGTSKFEVPPGDPAKDEYIVGYEDYCEIVNSINTTSNFSVTNNSLKKNFFVDFARMGFLDRFNKKDIKIDESEKERKNIGSAKLTDLATRLLNTNSLQIKYKIFTEGLDNLFEGAIINLVEFLYNSDYKNDTIDLYEFMFILSDTARPDNTRKTQLLNSYRNLKPNQRKNAKELIQLYCSPRSCPGNKTQQRDFHNWKNESQQIFKLLQLTVYFAVSNNSLQLNTGTVGIFTLQNLQRRSGVPKEEYFQKHGINKLNNFEFHHVVPFSSARNKQELTLIDNWQNLIYLRGDKHGELTKNKNKNVILHVEPLEAHFDDFDENRISACKGVTAMYNYDHARLMRKHNRKLMEKIYEEII